MLRSTRLIVRTGALAALFAFLTPSTALADATQGNLVALTARGNMLVRFDAGAPGTVISVTNVTGLPGRELLIGLDFRPSTGELYALGHMQRVYVIDLATGAATQVGTTFAGALNGIEYGFDFNPVPDRIRVVSDAGQSLRLNPDTGALAATDTSLAFAAGDVNAGLAPRVAAVAYTDNFAGTSKTTLFGLDAGSDTLVRVGGVDGTPSPNGGTLTTIGALGVDTNEISGFDISPQGGAFAVLTAPASSTSSLYTIDLATGAATLLGPVAFPRKLRDVAVVPASLPRAFAVTGSNRLVSFRPGRPSALLSDAPITGLQSGESIVGIDFRPATGDLLALGSSSRLYQVDTTNGVATAIGSAPFTPALSGSAFGMDFNPVVDRVRVVGESDQNLRLNQNTGAVAATDTSIDFVPADVNFGQPRTLVASAYTNNAFGVSQTTLYGIDSGLGILVLQGGVNGVPSPNGGLLTTVGSLGIATDTRVGFDITTYGGAFASLTPAGGTSSSLHVINLASGAATLVGAIGGGEAITGLAVEPPVAPRVYAITASNKLVSFAPGRPDVLLSSATITGLAGGEAILGGDFRPATGALVAVGSSNQLYRIDVASAAATAIGATFTRALGSNEVGVDFNPVPDRVRVVTSTEQNLRLNPNTGAVAAVDTPLAYAMGDVNFGNDPRVLAAAYTRNFAGTTSTTLYVLDATLDALVRQGGENGTPSPNGGQLATIGALGIDTNERAGFDISPQGGALASLTAAPGTASTLTQINLVSGVATALGTIGGGEPVVEIAIRSIGL